MARYASEGNEIFVCVVSNHDAPIYSSEHRERTKREAREAHRIIGVKSTLFLDYSAVTLNDLPVYDLNRSIGSVVKDIAPSVVFIPHIGDLHIDHQLVAKSALVAIRPHTGCPVTDVYAYETLSETEWNAPRVENAFMPNFFVDISGYLKTKIDAMACFQSQLHSPPHSRSLEAVEHLARYRGATVSAFAAESFILIRSVLR